MNLHLGFHFQQRLHAFSRRHGFRLGNKAHPCLFYLTRGPSSTASRSQVVDRSATQPATGRSTPVGVHLPRSAWHRDATSASASTTVNTNYVVAASILESNTTTSPPKLSSEASSTKPSPTFSSSRWPLPSLAQ